MIPRVAKRGTSFKGAGLYYLHDKRQDGEATRSTSDRVAWTYTRNLATADADFSLRIMAATAMDKDRLKAEAGIKNTGRKTKGDVYAYSLAWHPDEAGKIGQADMMLAVEESIAKIGANDHQAVIIAHNDTDHPHVHVIVNMVNPETGKNLPLKNDYKKLDSWAHEYRERRGELHYTPNRAKKYEAIEAKKRGEDVPFIDGEKSIPRGQFEAANDLKGTVRKDEYAKLMDTQKAADKKLVDTGLNLAKRQRSETHVLEAKYKNDRKLISTRYHQVKKAAIEEIKAVNRPIFAEIGRRQWQEKKLFEREEKSISGRFRNTLWAMREQEGKNILRTAFNSAYRRSVLDNRHKREKAEFRTGENRSIEQSVHQLNTRRVQKLAQKRGIFLVNREALIGRHKLENADLQAAWKVRNARKKQAIEALRTKGRLDAERKQDLDKLDQSEIVSARGHFKRKAQERQARNRSGRRKRSRKADD